MPAAKRSHVVDALMEGALKAANCCVGDYLDDKRILVVDHDASALIWLADLLRRTAGDDLEMSTARSFKAAIEICRAHQGDFDLVLLGHDLDGTHTGLELLGRLRRAGLQLEALTILHASEMPIHLTRAARSAGFDAAMATEDLDSEALLATLVQHWELSLPPSDD